MLSHSAWMRGVNRERRSARLDSILHRTVGAVVARLGASEAIPTAGRKWGRCSLLLQRRRVNTPLPEASVAVLFPVVAFFAGMTGEGDDADADAHERNSRAPYLARQMSWCRNQDTGGSTPPGSYVDGASRALL